MVSKTRQAVRRKTHPFRLPSLVHTTCNNRRRTHRHNMSESTMPGIMLGYSLGTNGSFKGGYLVAPLHAFKNVSLHKGTKVKIGNIPCHSNRDVHLDPDLGVHFPFKLESDRVNRTLEGMIEEEENNSTKQCSEVETSMNMFTTTNLAII